MLKDLIKLANALDSKGLRAEADFLDEIINKSANRKEDVAEKKLWQIPYGRRGEPRTSDRVGLPAEFVEVPADEDDSCKSCGGDGKIEVVRVHVCPDCGGDGMGEVSESWKIPQQRTFPPDPWDDDKVHQEFYENLVERHKYEEEKRPKYREEREFKRRHRDGFRIGDVNYVDDMVNLANLLDLKGFLKEADFLDEIINKWASDQVTEESAQSDLEWREEGTHSGKPYLVARDKKGVKYYINNGGYEVLHIFKDKDEDDIDRIVKLQVTSDLRLSNSLKDSLPGTESMRNKYKELANIQSQEFSKKFEAYKSELSKHGTSYVDLSDWWSDNIQIAPSL